MSRSLLPAVLLLAGCPPYIFGGPPGQPGDSNFLDEERPDDDTGTAIDTGSDEPTDTQYDEPAWVAVAFTTGFDAETRTFVGAYLPNEGSIQRVDPRLVIYLFGAGPTSSQAGSLLCELTVLFPPLQNDDEDSDGLPDLDGLGQGHPFSVALDFGASGVSHGSTCAGVLDPDRWGHSASETAERLVDHWGFSLVGPPTETHWAAIDQQLADAGQNPDHWDERMIAARLWSDTAGEFNGPGHDLWHALVHAGTVADGEVWASFEDLDGDFQHDAGEEYLFHTADEVLANAPTGVYVVGSSYLIGGDGWQPAGFLLWEP